MALFLRAYRPVTRLMKSSFTFSCSMTIGDLICQTLFPNQPLLDSSSPSPTSLVPNLTNLVNTDYDVDRTVRLFLPGLLASGPLSCAWNYLIDGTLGQARTLPKLLTKVAVHSVVFTPIMISSSLISITLLSGRSLNEARLRVEKDLPHALKMAYMYWPLQSLIMFRFFNTPQSRIVYQSSASGVWNIFLSYLANKHADYKIDCQQSLEAKMTMMSTTTTKKTDEDQTFFDNFKKGHELRSTLRLEKEKFALTKTRTIGFLRETVVSATILPIIHSIEFWARMIGAYIEEGLLKTFVSRQHLEEFFVQSQPFVTC